MAEITLLTTRLGRMSCRIVGAGNAPQLAVVLCHGFGAPGDDLVPLARELERLAPGLLERVRFYFPEGPLDLATAGLPGARAWWLVDIPRIQAMMAAGALRDLRQDVPEGLGTARRMLAEGIEHLQQTTGLGPDAIVIGGFSQGAMLATDWALRADDRCAALCIMSGTLLAEDLWRTKARRRAGLPVLMGHGRADPILPYLAAEWLRDMLVECDLKVDFVSFAGGHSIDPHYLGKLAATLEGLTASTTIPASTHP